VATTTELPVVNAVDSVSGDYFEKVEETASKSQADPGALTNPNPQPGVLKSRVRRKTPGGLIDVDERTSTAVQDTEVESLANNGVETWFYKSERSLVRNKVAPTTIPAFVVGGPQEVVASRRNGTNLFDVTQEKKTPKPQYYTTRYRYFAGGDGWGYRTLHKWFNKPIDFGASLVAGFRVQSFEAHPNEFGLEDGSAALFAPDINWVETDTVPITLREVEVTRTNERLVNESGTDKTKIQTYKVTQYVKFTSTLSSAINEIETWVGKEHGLASYSEPVLITDRAGRRFYRVTGVSKTYDYSDWGDAPAEPPPEP